MSISHSFPLANWSGWLVLAVLEASAQVTLKVASVDAASPGEHWVPLGSLLCSPLFIASVGCDALAFFVWIAILARYSLSFAIPVSASAYFAVILASSLFLHETVSLIHVCGLALIGGGIVMIART